MSKIDSQLALVVTDQETNAQIKSLGVGLLELRADLFKKLDRAFIIAQIKHRKLLKIPLLLTLRNQKKEGAVRTFSDAKKWQIISAALPLVEMIDIELSSPLLKKVVASSHEMGVKVIVSSHYLQSTPRDLEAIFKKSVAASADIVKIAVKVASFEEFMRLLVFTQGHRKDKLVTMSLGPWGALSRLILPAAGSRFTYTFLHKPTASGQVDVKTLKSHLNLYCPV